MYVDIDEELTMDRGLSCTKSHYSCNESLMLKQEYSERQVKVVWSQK